ncbi:unnamed protein product [Durusdinium trenchii]|uniref:Uncharacterized protein n=1 Tax=Durusdinium trenchii TaxID=1381693 RepID=A0ABP0I8S3_9DINO
MPVIRAAEPAAAASVPTAKSAPAAGPAASPAFRTVETIASITRPSLLAVNVSGRLLFKSGVSQSYPAMVLRIGDGTGSVAIKASAEGGWSEINVDDCVEVRGVKVKPAYAGPGIELHYDVEATGVKRRRSAQASQSSVHKLEGEHDWPLAELVTTPPPEVEELTEMPILWTAAVVVAEAGALEEGLEGEKDRREILTAEGGAV